MRIPFTPPAGIFSDDTTFAGEGSYCDGSNIRFRLGRAESLGGVLDALSGATVTGVCRNALSLLNANGTLNIVFGTHEKLEVFYQGEMYDITPDGLVAGNADSSGEGGGYGRGPYGAGTYGNPVSVKFARTWALDSYGNNIIANPRGGTIYMWEGDPEEEAAAIDNAPAIVSFALVTPERQILAFGCNEEISGDFNPLCIRGSDIEDPEDWTTATDGNAFEHILEGGGRIVTARQFGPFVAVWTTEAVYLGQFIGAPDQTYRFDLIAEGCGIAGPNAVAVVDQTAFWVGRDYQFRVWGAGGLPQILPCPVWKDFKDNLVTAQKEKLVAGQLAQFGEVWFHYPDARDGQECSRYLIFSRGETDKVPVWSRGIMARSAHIDAGAIEYPMMVDPDGMAWLHEHPEGDGLDWHIEASGQYLDEGNRRVMITRLTPDFEAQGDDVTMTLLARQYPQSDPVETSVTIPQGALKKDFRASGRVIGVRFSGTGYTRFGKPVFDAVAMGER